MLLFRRCGFGFPLDASKKQHVPIFSCGVERAWAAAAACIAASALCGCAGLGVVDVQSLLVPRFHRSEVIGFVAGFGTTFAAVPDLVAMFRRRSSAGMNPRMAAIMGLFQILWVYYGLLIQSRPVIAWNVVAVLINLSSVGAYFYFLNKERNAAATRGTAA